MPWWMIALAVVVIVVCVLLILALPLFIFMGASGALSGEKERPGKD